MTVLVKSQIRVLGLWHSRGNFWKTQDICSSRFPHWNRWFVQEDASEFLSGARQMENIEREQMTKYLVEQVSGWIAAIEERNTSNKTSIGSATRPSSRPALALPFIVFFFCWASPFMRVFTSDFRFFRKDLVITLFAELASSNVRVLRLTARSIKRITEGRWSWYTFKLLNLVAHS